VTLGAAGYKVGDMPDGIDVHVMPEGDDWVVMREGEGEAVSRYPTEDEAIDAGRDVARNEQSQLLIHGHDGEVRERDSYEVGPHDLRV
jgi:hypothetical protein